MHKHAYNLFSWSYVKKNHHLSSVAFVKIITMLATKAGCWDKAVKSYKKLVVGLSWFLQRKTKRSLPPESWTDYHTPAPEDHVRPVVNWDNFVILIAKGHSDTYCEIKEIPFTTEVCSQPEANMLPLKSVILSDEISIL